MHSACASKHSFEPFTHLYGRDKGARLEYLTTQKGSRMTDLANESPSERQKGSRMKQEVFLPDDYRPAEDEPFMNDLQTEYFRRKLYAWKSDLMAETRDTLEGLQDQTRNIPDISDRASEETDRALELRTRDRQRKLVAKIDSALRRIDEGEYGYCEDTGEPISLKRLDARPIATLSLEAQERHERREKVHRDD
jgi:DnaK suppressor protein